jgi:DNA-binding SARP family transcriptional activator
VHQPTLDGIHAVADPARAGPAVRLVTMGSFAVWRDGVPLEGSAFCRQKVRMVLAALLCARGAVHRECLLEWIWPSLPRERGTAALHTTVYELRRALDGGSRRPGRSLIAVEGETYRLVLGDEAAWDAAEFLRLARRAEKPATPRERIRRLAVAEAAYAGPPLAEWAYEEWARELRTEVEEARRGVLERLAAALLEAGEVSAGVARYRRLLALEPEREAWHRALMHAYWGAGEPALAIRQYHECRARLRGELGLEPTRETRELFASVLRSDRRAPLAALA